MVLAVDDPWVRWDWVRRHGHDITSAAREHIELTAIAVVVGLLIALPIALFASRSPRLAKATLGSFGVLYTVPSLALFAMLVPWTGLSTTTAEIGLVGYTLLILERNVLAGLASVPDEVREAADGMGFGRWRRLLRVELPIALPVILAGIRIATVTTIGLVTVTALIGKGGLGRLILEGLIRDFRTPLVVGCVVSIALAAVADVALLGVERVTVRWNRR